MKKNVTPYSTYRKSGDLYFISGQLPICSNTGQIPEGFSEQVRCSLKNLENIVISLDLTMNEVIKTTVFLANIENFEVMNTEYTKFFTESAPARSAFEVGRLPKGAQIEIEAIVGEREG
jgi:2-iminobutanoate/2-iminopropanoate deaminase